MSAETKAIYMVEGAEPSDLPLADEDRAVCDEIDGRHTKCDIIRALSLSEERILEALELLQWLGVIRYGPPVPNTEAAAPSPPPEEPVRAKPEEDLDIDPARRAQIGETFSRLSAASHYELLGVPTSADRKEIKAAYFERIPVFHPDRYFGKNLGPYRAQLDKIFQRLTEAHDVLSRKKTRAEYDDYLGLTKQTEVLQGMPSAPDSILRAYLDGEEIDSIAPPKRFKTAPRKPRDERPPPPEELPPTQPSRKLAKPEVHVDPARRKRALARRFRGLSRGTGGETRSDAEPQSEQDKARARERAAEDLKKLYAVRTGDMRIEDKLAHYVRKAEELMDTDPVSAAGALQMAVELAPDDEPLKAKHEAADARAAAELSEMYLKRAKYEEDHRDWVKAAKSYARAALGRPNDPDTLERAAFSAIEAGDAKQAVGYAKRAVLEAPRDEKVRSTAARAYHAAGMMKSAIGELQRAIELSPNDRALSTWLDELRREAS